MLYHKKALLDVRNIQQILGVTVNQLEFLFMAKYLTNHMMLTEFDHPLDAQ